MKPRYKKGYKVKLYKAIHPLDREYVGKIFTIKSVYEGSNSGSWYTVEGVGIGFREDQLKKYAPSRTGTRDPKTGRFVSKKYKFKVESFRHGINLPDSKQRNYQKILTKLDEIEKKIDELGRRV